MTDPRQIQAQAQQYMERLEQLDQQIKLLSQQREVALNAINETSRAISTLQEYKALKEDEELLVPIGGDTFLKAKAVDDKAAIIGVGSDVLIEKDTDRVIEQLSDRAKVIEETGNKITSGIAELTQEAEALSKRLEELRHMSAQPSGPPPPVIRPPNMGD